MSGGPTAYRLIGSEVTALCFVVIFCRVFCQNALTVDSSPVDQLVCLCLGDVFSEDQSSLQGRRCVVSMDYG